jgi:hypothetical protein
MLMTNMSVELMDYLSDQLFTMLSNLRIKEIHIHHYNPEMFMINTYDSQVRDSKNYVSFIRSVRVMY